MLRNIWFFLFCSVWISVSMWCEEIRIDIDGLVCSFCAQGIEKTFQERPEIASITIILEKGEVILTLKDKQVLDDATIKKMVFQEGFTVKAIHRTSTP